MITNRQETMLIFDALGEIDSQRMRGCGRTRIYSKGETIFCRGDPGIFIFIVEEGIVEISVTSLDGRKSVLNHMGPQEILGEIALLDQGERSADAIAMTDVSGLVLDRQTFKQFLSEHADACIALIAMLCTRVRNASEMFETRSLAIGRTRLARCILRLAEKWGEQATDGTIRIGPNISQSDFGEFAGVARENVNRHFQTWSRAGILSFNKGQITLTSREQLEEIAEL